MAKKDLSSELQALYFPSEKEPEMIKVPRMKFIAVDGKGNPNTSKDFQAAIGALYSVAYTAKFMLKKKDAKKDFLVMPLEALWWMPGKKDFFNAGKDEWSWKAMIMMPANFTESVLKDTLEQLRKKGKDKELPGLKKLKLEEFEEGLSAQIMHIGPYAGERPTIEKLHKFILDNGKKLRGKHHEIYLGDPRRSKPEKLKTVVRQPCE